jgi:hypothetical protein
MRSPHLDRESLLALARKCQKYAKSLTEADNIAMLRLWATELAGKADEIERQRPRSGLRHLQARARRGAIVVLPGHRRRPPALRRRRGPL